MSQLDSVLDSVDQTIPDALKRLLEFLKIQSISTDPAYKANCLEAATWLQGELNTVGFEAEIMKTPGHPMVVGHLHSDPKAPHVLFYGHYDVQPVDPLNLWNNPPFEPSIESTPAGDVIRGRGAADDKGQLMTFVEACRAIMNADGKLPVNVTMFFEGEEESGSPSLIPFMKDNVDKLKADIALVCDTGMWDSDTPAISTRLRGMVAEQITITGPNKDLHSGMYGGPSMNPIRVLCKILADLHDETGRVTLDGFYEGVEELPEQIKQQWQALNHDEKAFLGEVGLSVPAGEEGYSVLEQIWSRPTCDVNGITGGYSGEGFKTVLPSQAMAKVSFRLVGDQNPQKIRDALFKFINERLPADCTVEYKSKDASGATVMPVDAPVFERAHQALTSEWPNPAVYAGCGGSIPVVGHIKSILDMDSMLIGFGLDDDAIHSPNEKYNVRSFHKGTRSWVRVLYALV